MFAVKKVFRQTTTTCDRVKHSIEKYKNVFVENIRFSVYIEISESRGISSKVIGRPSFLIRFTISMAHLNVFQVNDTFMSLWFFHRFKPRKVCHLLFFRHSDSKPRKAENYFSIPGLKIRQTWEANLTFEAAQPQLPSWYVKMVFQEAEAFKLAKKTR